MQIVFIKALGRDLDTLLIYTSSSNSKNDSLLNTRSKPITSKQIVRLGQATKLNRKTEFSFKLIFALFGAEIMVK